jgi:hypothetical protein
MRKPDKLLTNQRNSTEKKKRLPNQMGSRNCQLKGLRLKVQYANVWQQGNARDTQTEFRFIVDYTVLFR